MNRIVVALALLGVVWPANAFAQQGAEQAEEIIVTGNRSGIPLWHVEGAQGTLILVGTIEDVSKTTVWDPEALVEALRKADQIMFPEAHAFTASPFSLIGWIAKYKAMGSLPKDESLSDYVSTADLGRLAALKARKRVRGDYQRRHPLHLANDLRDEADDGIERGPTAGGTVRRAISKYKLTLVPAPKSKAKPIVKDLFASSPAEHVPCLSDAITLAEAGPAAVQARSDAWAARRIGEVLSSPAEKIRHSCWPANTIGVAKADLVEQMRGLLDQPKVTVAVLSLEALAGTDGILDALQASGHDIRGTRWKD